METTRNGYKVKREGLDVWVPQYTNLNQDSLHWNDYREMGQRVSYSTRQEAQAYLDLKKFIDTLSFQQYRKITPSRLRVLTEADHHQRNGIIETREGPVVFQVGDYLGQGKKGEYRIRQTKVRRDFRQVSAVDASGWADYQPLDTRAAAKLPKPCTLPNGQHGETGDYLVQGSDSQWIVAQDVFEARYRQM